MALLYRDRNTPQNTLFCFARLLKSPPKKASAEILWKKKKASDPDVCHCFVGKTRPKYACCFAVYRMIHKETRGATLAILSISAIKSSLRLKSLSFRRKIVALCLFHRLYYNFPQLRGKLLNPPHRTSRRLFNSCSIQRLHGSTSSFNQSFCWSPLQSGIYCWIVLSPSVNLSCLSSCLVITSHCNIHYALALLNCNVFILHHRQVIYFTGMCV